jgi:hypothetical protein
VLPDGTTVYVDVRFKNALDACHTLRVAHRLAPIYGYDTTGRLVIVAMPSRIEGAKDHEKKDLRLARDSDWRGVSTKKPAQQPKVKPPRSYGRENAKAQDWNPGDTLFLTDIEDPRRSVPVNFRGNLDRTWAIVILNGFQVTVEQSRLRSPDQEGATMSSSAPRDARAAALDDLKSWLGDD